MNSVSLTTDAPQRKSSPRSDGLDQAPFIHLVPETWEENLDYRESMRKLASTSARARKNLWIMCRRDILYFLNTFGYVFEPRNSRRLPFNTPQFQKDCIIEMVRSIGRYHLHVKKSRDMRASWSLCAVYAWFWLFQSNFTCLLGSRKEEYVDSPDQKSLFWKILYILDHCPPWMLPKNRTKTFMHMINRDRNNSIDGEASNPEWGRGDRRTTMGKDEFAFWPDDHASLANTDDATKNRIWISTPNGTATAFYEIGKNPAVVKLVLHWTRDPDKAAGLYGTENGKVRLMDPHYVYPANYPYILDGKLRSPWYDAECRERNNDKVRIGQELDLDDFGSVQQFFDANMLDRYATAYCEAPWHVGEIEFDHETLDPTGWSSLAGGRWQLWVHPDAAQKMPTDRRFIVAVDIAAGTGSSNSAIAVGDCKLRRVVALFTSSTVSPETLARIAVAACKFFAGSAGESGALLSWEVNGYGKIFGKTVVEVLKWRNLDYRQKEDSITKKVTDTPGWWSTGANKTSLIGDLRRAIGMTPRPEIIIPSIDIINEMKEFVHGTNGTPEHSGSANAKDPSGAGDAHGDRVIPTALVNRLFPRTPMRSEDKPADPGPGTFKGRQLRHKEKSKAQKYWA